MGKYIEKPVQEKKQANVRYVCHGCTQNAGEFPNSDQRRITCPYCGLDQLSVPGNYILL